MARIRSAKPELRTSRLVASWPREVRYFWVLLWGYLDDKGRGLDSPKAIAGDCFPWDDDIDAATVHGWLKLMTVGRNGKPGPICRYEVDGVEYIHSLNWEEHQKPNRPTPSRLPACPLHEGLTETLNGHSVPGAAEQQSRGAEEQQQPPREYLTPPPKTQQAVRLIVNASGTEPEHAQAAVALIASERKPRNLTGLVRTLLEAGEIGEWLERARAELDRQRVQAAQAQARASPPCPHGQPGGNLLHPVSQEPWCPVCRKQNRLAA